MPEQQNIANDASTVEPTRSKTMSEAALAANRANAQKSTGPRTATGKLKAASNSMKHGLYSLKNFDDFISDHDLALAVSTNFIEQFNPVTPSEVALVHQLIHAQIRFLQMEFLYGQAMRFRVEDILAKPLTFLPAIMRELDRLPGRIQRLIKTIRAEIAQREAYIGHGENVEIETIEDNPPLPGRPGNEIYTGLTTATGDIPIERLPHIQALAKTNPKSAGEMARKLVLNYCDGINEKHQAFLKQTQTQPPAEQS